MIGDGNIVASTYWHMELSCQAKVLCTVSGDKDGEISCVSVDVSSSVVLMVACVGSLRDDISMNRIPFSLHPQRDAANFTVMKDNPTFQACAYI